MSAALRNKPARFMASLFSLPAGIKRAASRASVALETQSSSVSVASLIQWQSVRESRKLDKSSRDHKRLRVSARHPTFVFEMRRVLHQRNTLVSEMFSLSN